MKHAWPWLLFTILLVGCTPTTEIFVVRHGEKAAPIGDVELSGAGKNRAEDLKALLHGKKLNAVFSTNFNRTRQTATPTANDQQLPVTRYASGDSLLPALLQQPGKFLVVSHSNRILPMLKAGGLQPTVDSIGDDTYYHLFIVRKRNGKAPILKEKTYGVKMEYPLENKGQNIPIQ